MICVYLQERYFLYYLLYFSEENLCCNFIIDITNNSNAKHIDYL